MSYCKSNGKDKRVFVTEEDVNNQPVLSDLLHEDEEYGAILPDGSINWDCPCLGGLPTGPCGDEFKSSFSCFHYSTADPKGSDCIEQFIAMQECFKGHPELYSKYENIEDGDKTSSTKDDEISSDMKDNQTTDDDRTDNNT